MVLREKEVYNVSGTPKQQEGLFTRLSLSYLSGRRQPKKTKNLQISSPKDFNHVTHVDPRDVKGNFGRDPPLQDSRERPDSFYLNVPNVSEEFTTELSNSGFYGRSPSFNFLDHKPVRQPIMDKLLSKQYSHSMDDLSTRAKLRQVTYPISLAPHRLSCHEETYSSPSSSSQRSLSRSPPMRSPVPLSSADKRKNVSIDDLLVKFKNKPVRTVRSGFSASSSSKGSMDSLNEPIRSYPSCRISENGSTSESPLASHCNSTQSRICPQVPLRRTILTENTTVNEVANNNENNFKLPVPKPRTKLHQLPIPPIDDDIEPDVVCDL